MAKTDAAPASADETARALPSHVILQADWSRFIAGQVLAADADLIAALEIEHVPYRPATDRERALGAGVAD